MTKEQKTDAESLNPLRQVEKILGKSLEKNTIGSITNFNETPDLLIEDARKLPTILSNFFLRHYFDSNSQKYLTDFIDDVVIGHQDAKNWRKGRILVPLFTFEELLSLETIDILAPIRIDEEEDWWRIIPDRQQWEEGIFITGSPAIVKPNLDYEWTAPEHVFDLLFSEYIQVEKITDSIVNCRRWVASIIALQAHKKGILKDFSKMKAFLAGLSQKETRISRDSLLIIKALEKELKNCGVNDSDIPGFCGEDQWYAG